MTRSSRPGPWQTAAAGLILGTLLWLGACELGIRALPVCRTAELLLPAALAGSLIALTRARSLLWLLGAVECVALLLIGCTQLACPAMRAWVRSDRVQPAPAIVVLSSNVYSDGSLDAHAHVRLVHACELLGAGMSHRLVVTRLAPPWPSGLAAVRRELRQLRLNVPVEEVGPVVNTHDEALAVARLAHARGWKRIILVSEPMHLRRAGAVFAHTGLQVSCSPSASGFYDLHALETSGDRLSAFRDWIWEWIGYRIYQRRGWI